MLNESIEIIENLQESGKLKMEGKYLDGNKIENWDFYFESGKIEQRAIVVGSIQSHCSEISLRKVEHYTCLEQLACLEKSCQYHLSERS